MDIEKQLEETEEQLLKSEEEFDRKVKEKTIVVRAVYCGTKATLSEPSKPFCLADLPIIEPLLQVVEKDAPMKIDVHPSLYFYADFLLEETPIVIARKTQRVGFRPGAQLVIFDVPISTAEKFALIPDWRFERLSWTKYRELLVRTEKDLLADHAFVIQKMTEWWPRFFDLNLNSELLVVNLNLYLGRHQRDPEFPTSQHDRYHYHIRLHRILTHQLLSAVEYLEQGFHLLNIECDLVINYEGSEVYRTPQSIMTLDDDAKK